MINKQKVAWISQLVLLNLMMMDLMMMNDGWWAWMKPSSPSPPPPTPHPSSSSTKIHQFLLWSGFTSAHDDLFFGLYVCVFVLFMSVVPIQFRNLNSNKYLFLLSQLSLSFVLGGGEEKGWGGHLYILSIS
jgi:hypothetical protein